MDLRDLGFHHRRAIYPCLSTPTEAGDTVADGTKMSLSRPLLLVLEYAMIWRVLLIIPAILQSQQ